jgi:RNA polymerase sigma-70 factor (ECF subfamily)
LFERELESAFAAVRQGHLVEDGTTDQQLLERIVSGDKGAFWEAWLRHAVYVSQICRQMGGDEDDVHDVMLKLSVKLPTHASQISNLRAWMGKLAQNFCIDRHRASRRHMEFVSLDDVELTDPRSIRKDRVLVPDSLAHMLEKMPAALQEAMGLRFTQGLSYKEIASRLNLPEASVRKRIERARKALRRELGDGFTLEPTSVRKEAKDVRKRNVSNRRSFLRLVPVVLRTGAEMDVPVTVETRMRQPNLTIDALRKYIQRHPQSLKKRLVLAHLLRAAGQWREAVVEQRRILEKRPGLTSVWLRLAETLRMLGNSQEAVEAYIQAARAVPVLATRRYIDGMIAACRGEYKVSLNDLEDAVALSPGHQGFQWAMLTAHWMIGNLNETIAIGHEILKAHPLNANAHIACCQALAALGRMEEVGYHAKECLKTDPENVLALRHMVSVRCALWLVRGEEGKVTLRMIKTLLHLSPCSAEAHEALAHFYISRGQFTKGLQILRAFISNHPRKPFGWFYYAQWLFHACDFKNAEDALARAYALYPSGRVTWEQACRFTPPLQNLESVGIPPGGEPCFFPAAWDPWFAAVGALEGVDLGTAQANRV